MKKYLLAFAFLFCMVFTFSQQRTIRVNCVNRITTVETKYKNGEVTEVIKKDMGYSSINQQLINFVVIKLQDLNFNVVLEDSGNYDYEILIDSLCTELGSWNSTYIRLNDFKNNKKYSRFLRNNKFSFDSLTEEMAKRITGFVTENLDKEMTEIFFYNADRDNGLYSSAIDSVPVRKTSINASKIMSTLSRTNKFSILEMDYSLEQEADTAWYSIKIKTTDGVEGWINSNVVKLKE